jgi:hypothetical protein
MSSARLWKIAVVVVVVFVFGAGTYAWFYFTRPAPLGLATANPLTPAPSAAANDPLASVCRQPAMPAKPATSGLGGLWVIQPGSVVGYRAHEKFAELPTPHEAVARTERVGGWLLVTDATGSLQIETGCVAVELSTLRSVDQVPGLDMIGRDMSSRSFLHTSEHPYGVFQPFPIQLVDISGRTHDHVQVSGALELNGITKPAQFSLDVRLADKQLAAAGHSTVSIDDYDVTIGRGPDNLVSVDKNFTLEVSLILLRQ